MQYILLNLKSFVKNYTGIFLLVIICQLVCVLLTLFSYGMYENFLNESELAKQGRSSYDVYEYEGFKTFAVKGELDPGIDIYPAELTDFYEKTAEILGEKIEYIDTQCENNIDIIMGLKNGKLVFSDDFRKNMEQMNQWKYGRSFSDAEFISGEKVCIAPASLFEEYKDINNDPTPNDENFSYKYTPFNRDGKWYLDIEGEEYECIGICNFIGMYYIPQKNMPENIKLISLPSIELSIQLTQQENEQMQKLYDEYFPMIQKDYYELTLIDNEIVNYYNTNMWIAVFIALISSISLAMIMNYILTKRRNELAIFRINGCSINKARKIYVNEIMLLIILVYAVSLIIWALLILPILETYFSYIRGAFSLKIYLLIFVCYIAISYIVINIMVVFYLRKSPVDLLRRR